VALEFVRGSLEADPPIPAAIQASHLKSPRSHDISESMPIKVLDFSVCLFLPVLLLATEVRSDLFVNSC
jgi:hypothetical protein